MTLSRYSDSTDNYVNELRTKGTGGEGPDDWGWQAGLHPCGRAGRGSHTSTSHLNLSRCRHWTYDQTTEGVPQKALTSIHQWKSLSLNLSRVRH